MGNRSTDITIDGVLNRYEYVLYYDADPGFYAIIPPGFEPAIEVLTSEERTAFHLEYHRKRGVGMVHVITGQNETEVGARLFKILKSFLEADTHHREVIAVYFSSKAGSNSNLDGDDIEPVGWEFSCDYLTERKIGGKMIYGRYEADHWDKKKKVYRSKDLDRSFRRPVPVIIPDTPESRKFLEDLAKLIDQTGKKLQGFLGQADRLEKAIASKTQILLSNA